MKKEKIRWTKKELQVYILLLCANADAVKTEEEMSLIRSKVDKDTFEKMQNEIAGDTEEESLDKIQNAVAIHHYSYKEILQLQKEMQEVFFSDNKYTMLECTMDRILRNMLY
ncbi:hypothetical protein RM553_13230 [Zunongwangia sp. F363]|uniref:TerB family tellurite resistance protein n=1 Tax=Autumnicola tepida TaxID=3075595 RepID=A0ABU3CC52_9FLAO|nr:hypothetical protein [Zunongwangia sp. F363]MDT0643797.1 hypothetical protein [Zunongwangia sp. F363]